ncbi:MAG: hypothetical protein NZO58_07795, partial [Gemmataceae bacterium]|nr:hypothetical protein [Gemmataceae bacterium]
SKTPGDNSPEGVLRERKAVCAGYANLLAALGKRLGLEIVTIDGFAKGVGYDETTNVAASNHAWSAVRLAGTWHLIDATWGAGYVNGRTFVKRFADCYFLIPPEKLAFSHLPTSDKWQLLNPPLSAEQFLAQPKVERAMWELGVSADMIRKALASNPDGSLVKVYSFPGDSTTLVQAPLVRTLKAGTKYAFEFKSDDFVDIAGFQNKRSMPLAKKGNVFRGVLVPQAGDFKIVGRTMADPKRLAGILEYLVE